MYNEDHRNQNRMAWSYRYFGRELLPYARRKYVEYQAQENVQRERMAIMIKDPSTFHDDRELQQVKEDIDRLSAVREQLEVHCVEFERKPEDEYNVRLSDIVFYGIHLASTRDWLGEANRAWGRVTVLEKEASKLEQEINVVFGRQERLMSLLGRLKGGGEEGALRARYVARIDALHTRYLECEERLGAIAIEVREGRAAAWELTHALEV